MNPDKFNKAYVIRDLTKEEVTANYPKLKSISSDIDDESWTLDNFLAERPGKWKFSFAVWHKGLPVGYAILSVLNDSDVHLHHFMVSAKHRRQGLGGRIVAEMISRCQNADMHTLKLKVNKSNHEAIRFYESHSFFTVDQDESYHTLSRQLGSELD